MILRAHRVVRRLAWALISTALALLAPAASAEEAGAPDVEKRQMEGDPAPVNLMAATAPARLANSLVTATTWAGYDGALQNPRVSALVEARLLRWLGIAVGADSSADADGEFTLRPLVTLRVQPFSQESVGVDMAASFTYRQDRFQIEGGFFEGTIAVGRRFDRLVATVNVTFGVDAEGDDQEGELRAAALYEISRGFYLGVDGRYRHDLGSTDPNREERKRAESETLGGATAVYVHGRWAVMLEAGFSRIETTVAQNGPVALAGYSATF